MRDKVDYVIIDSPLPLCAYYDREGLPGFKELVFNMYNTFTNYNFRLKRHFKYQEEGRYQTESEANKVDEDLINLIKENGVDLIDICNPNAQPEYEILEHVLGIGFGVNHELCEILKQ